MSNSARLVVTALVIVLSACLAPAQTTPAQTTPATRPAAAGLTWTTDRVVIFKDGYGLVTQTGRAVADAEGRVFTYDVPDAAVLGCFWAVAADDGRIVGMRAEWEETRQKRERTGACATMAELLRANVGKTLTLELGTRNANGEPVVQQGRLLELLDAPQEPAGDVRFAGSRLLAAHGSGGPGHLLSVSASATPYTTLVTDAGMVTGGNFNPDAIAGGGTLVRDLSPRAGGGQYLVLRQENDRKLVLPVAQVSAVRGGDDVVTEISREQELLTRAKRLGFEFGAAHAEKEVAVRLFYFTPGLRWIPTYRLSGELKDMGELALQGEILNDVTDIENAALDLVVGVPNFRFRDSVSPLVLELAMRRAISAAGMNLGNNAMLNSQFALDSRRREETTTVQPDVPAEVQGKGADAAEGDGQDLFVYPLKGFSLKKGARATVPLWQQSVNLKHLYAFDLRTRRGRGDGRLLDDQRFQPQQPAGAAAAPTSIVINHIWHQLELANKGSVPWTTGTALLTRGTLPLGQELLVFTPPGRTTTVPVTVSLDLRGTIGEEEISRDPNPFHFDGSRYVQVRKRGTIMLKSSRKESATIRVSLSIGGKVTSASDDGAIRLNEFRSGDWENGCRANHHSDVAWDVPVEAGATKTVTYELELYAG